jgi:hypothetical protein
MVRAGAQFLAMTVNLTVQPIVGLLKFPDYTSEEAQASIAPTF